MPHRTRRALLTFGADLLCVLAFALGGKSSHEAEESDWVVLAIVWPFALAVAVAHAWLSARGRDTLRVWHEGAAITTVTYVVGMIFRSVSGRGLAAGFLVVAAVFLAVTMLGWRAVASRVSPRR